MVSPYFSKFWTSSIILRENAIFKDLQESLPLRASELDEDVDKLEESRALLGVPQLGLGVLQDLLPREHGVLVPTKEGPHLRIDMISGNCIHRNLNIDVNSQ